MNLQTQDVVPRIWHLKIYSMLSFSVVNFSSIHPTPLTDTSESAVPEALTQKLRNRLKRNVSRFEAAIQSMCFNVLVLSCGTAPPEFFWSPFIPPNTVSMVPKFSSSSCALLWQVLPKTQLRFSSRLQIFLTPKCFSNPKKNHRTWETLK